MVVPLICESSSENLTAGAGDNTVVVKTVCQM